MDKTSINIRREPFAEIVARTKKIEFREIKPYWKTRLEKLSIPFELRIINGMDPKAPEATVIIKALKKRGGYYELHIGKILSTKNWTASRKMPKTKG